MSRRIVVWAVLVACLSMTACLEPRGPNRTWMNQTSQVELGPEGAYACVEIEPESFWRE